MGTSKRKEKCVRGKRGFADLYGKKKVRPILRLGRSEDSWKRGGERSFPEKI